MVGSRTRHAFGVALMCQLACQVACGDSVPEAPSSGTRKPLPPHNAVAGTLGVSQAAAGGAPGINMMGGAIAGSAAPAVPRGNTPSVAGGAGMAPATEITTSYQRDIRPVLEGACVTCHVAGGAGKVVLDSWDAVKSAADAVVSSVAGGTMPPWPADDACHSLRDSRLLAQNTRDLFVRWRDEGFPEGSPNEYRTGAPAASSLLGPASVSLAADEAYTPKPAVEEERCFITERVFSKDTYITAVDIVPDQLAEVADIEVQRLTAEQYEQLHPIDLLSADPGYPCLLGVAVAEDGTLSVPEPQNLFSWRPGVSVVRFDKGDAVYLAAGSRIMLKVHYNTRALPGGWVPTPDLTKVSFWTLPQGQQPDRVIYRQTITTPLYLPTNASRVVVENEPRFNSLAAVGPTGAFVPGEVIGVTLQANQFATRMSATLVKAGDGEQDCLVNVPRWDSTSQLDYVLQSGVQYTPDDEVHTVCVYDNSAENQPMVNGSRQESKGVLSGDGAADELCRQHVWLRMDRRLFFGQRLD